MDAMIFSSSLFLLLTILIIRILYVVGKRCKPPLSPSACTLKTIVALGSGGHTAEILNVLRELDMKRFYPRIYIAALTDNMSLTRAKTEEEKSALHSSQKESIQYLQIYRSREVGQSYITSIFTTVYALANALYVVFSIRPNVILCNGPGTCIPICIAGFLLKVFGVKWVAIIYIESIARVEHLSLSGLLLYKLGLADKLFVQWPQLKQKYPQCEFVGQLM